MSDLQQPPAEPRYRRVVLKISGEGFVHAGERGIDLHLLGEYVRAETDAGMPLPFIPPLSLGVGVIYEGATWRASADVRWYDDQDRVPATITPTAGYTMVSSLVGYRIIGSGLMHEILLRGINLRDVDARLATSRLKDVVPLPGRNISVVYRLIF